MSNQRKIQPVLNALPVFEEAARQSSFSLAAQTLGMAQPSVSRFISNLENQIDIKLFDRHHNRVTLTTQGKQLYEAIALGMGHIRSVLDEITATATTNSITISCTHGFAHMWVLPRMEKLTARLGEQEVKILTTDHTNQFSTDNDQLAIRFGDGNWPDSKSILLFKEEVFPVCSLEFAARHNLLDGKIKPEDFTTLSLIAQDNSESLWLDWPGWFEFFGTTFEYPSDTNIINNYAFVLQSAMEGKGIALAWNNLIEPYLSNGWLTKLPNFSVTTTNGYYLVLPHGHPIEDVARSWIANTT